MKGKKAKSKTSTAIISSATLLQSPPSVTAKRKAPSPPKKAKADSKTVIIY
jgi:hypothetical protein